MKITIEEEELKVSIEIPDGQEADKLIEHFEGLMIAFTYHPDSVGRAILERAYDYKELQAGIDLDSQLINNTK